MNLSIKHLLGLENVPKDDINAILDTAFSFREVLERPVKKVPTLQGKTIVNIFFEPSTRTRISFELAEKRLSADTVNFTASGSSLSKGESLKDTAMRVVPFFERRIAPELRAGKSVLVVAHGNSLRSLIMQLDRLTPEQVIEVELATGVPLIYRLNADGSVAAKHDLAA